MTATNQPAESKVPTGNGAPNDVEQIKAGIERTQAHLAQTVAQLQQKLTVSHFVDEATRSARDTLHGVAGTGLAVAAIAATHVLDLAEETHRRAQRKPAAAVLIGAGLAALLWNTARRRRSAV